MKKSIILIALIACSTAVFSQKVVSKYMDKYAADETFTKVSLSSKMFSLFAEMEGSKEDEKLLLDITSKLKGMKVLAAEKVSNPSELYKTALSDVSKAGFEELMTVQDAEENVKISIREAGGIIEELILVVGGKEKFAMISLFGEIDLKQISKLASIMRVGQLKYLENLGESSN